jgi:thiosulfate/3-mercaptopyruvate sulfurtransferase
VCLALVSIGVVAATAAGQWWEKPEPGPEPVYPDVTTTPAALIGAAAGGVRVLDARPADAYEAGHIPGAVSAPAASLPALDDAGAFLGSLGLEGDERVVCVGADPDLADASLLFWFLEASGAEGVSVLSGGIPAWTAAGGRLESRADRPRRAEWTRPSAQDRTASREHVAAVYGEKGHELVDVRGWDTWEGRPQEPGVAPAVRTGHIPHALPYDFAEFLSSDGTLRSAEDTRATFSRLGPRPSNPVNLEDEFVVYGEGPEDAALGYFLLRRAGVARVRLYPGGFGEWSAVPDLPITRVIHAEEVLARLNREPRLLVPDAPPRAFVLLDVRHDRDYEVMGHVPGAVNLSSHLFADSLDVTLARHWPGIDRATTPIVCYCYGPSCIRSRNCSTMAARAGFVNTERFYGGIEEWNGVGAPVVKALP